MGGLPCYPWALPADCDSPESQIEIASFRPLKPRNLANSKPRPAVKSIPAQWLGSFYRPTKSDIDMEKYRPRRFVDRLITMDEVEISF
jgi:hypothetical protein